MRAPMCSLQCFCQVITVRLRVCIGKWYTTHRPNELLPNLSIHILGLIHSATQLKKAPFVGHLDNES